VLCIEGAAQFLPYLSYNVNRIDGPLRVIDRFVLPLGLRGTALAFETEPGTGHLRPAAGAQPIDESRFVTIAEVVETAREMAGGVAPALVKVDTDGLDALLLAELLDTLECPIYFECDTIRSYDTDSSPWQPLFERFEREQRPAVIFDNVGLPLCCTQDRSGAVLSDLTGYIHLQHGVTPVRTHYLDVLLFPRGRAAQYAKVAGLLRRDLLKPYRFVAA
jgi:hypothetical protein